MSDLDSGLIGAIIGGACSLLGAFLATRWQIKSAQKERKASNRKEVYLKIVALTSMASPHSYEEQEEERGLDSHNTLKKFIDQYLDISIQYAAELNLFASEKVKGLYNKYLTAAFPYARAAGIPTEKQTEKDQKDIVNFLKTKTDLERAIKAELE